MTKLVDLDTLEGIMEVLEFVAEGLKECQFGHRLAAHPTTYTDSEGERISGEDGADGVGCPICSERSRLFDLSGLPDRLMTASTFNVRYSDKIHVIAYSLTDTVMLDAFYEVAKTLCVERIVRTGADPYSADGR